MSILEEILETLADAPLEGVWMGLHWTAVMVTRGGRSRCGLASTLRGDEQVPHGAPFVSVGQPELATSREGAAPGLRADSNRAAPVRWAGHLLEHSALELASLACSASTLEASIGVAAINALLEVDEGACRDENAFQTLQREGAGRQVALVGHFPFIPRLRPAVGELWVLEHHPQPGEFPAERAADLFPQADVVAITGTALINHTLEDLLPLCRPGAFVMILGPSTPLSPTLFRHGVTVLAGSLVVDPAVTLRFVGQGATFQQVEGARTVVLREPDRR